MKKPATLRFLILLAGLSYIADFGLARPIVEESTRVVLAGVPASSFVEILISFENDLDLAALKMARLSDRLDRAANYRDVMQRLRRNREELEASLTPRLEVMKADGAISSYRYFTVSKTVLVRTRADNVENLAQLPGARLLTFNHYVSLIEPVEEKPASVLQKTNLANSALAAINVPMLWERGLTGKGTLICSFDTGVDGDHPALASKWRGNLGSPAAAAWFAPHSGTVPTDNIGHGTHVMGIMVGSIDGDTIGVAPGAQWISAAVIDQGVSFSTTLADIISAFNWALNPDGNLATIDDVPDVICNSWGVPRGILGDCNSTFWTAIDNVEAAGIVTIFAAGNEGPDPASLRNPADRASSPLNTLSVGAVDPATHLVAPFSSRGPGGCGGSAIKPELVAPGVGIYSSYKDGGYKVMSGTSMATPFVAGVVALMRQYNPQATVAEIKQALIQAAIDLGPPGEDNDYGNGLIDAALVLDHLPAPEQPIVNVHSHQIMAGGDLFADPGESAELILTLNEPTGTLDSIDVWVTPNSAWVDATQEIIRFRFAQGASYAVSTQPFHIQVSTEAISGSMAELIVHFGYMNGVDRDSTSYSILIGHQVPGDIFAISAGELELSASEFGQFGFGTGSIYQAGGQGFRFHGSDNLLYEGGLIVGRGPHMVSDGIRDAEGRFKESDFVPMHNTGSLAAVNFDVNLVADYTDQRALLPIPIQINQAAYGSVRDFAILQFDILNPSPERIESLAVGLFLDFDINGQADLIGFDTLMGMIYQYNPDLGLYVGLAGVSANEFGFAAGLNEGGAKRGFDTAKKFDLVSGAGIRIEGSGAGDWYFTVSRLLTQVEGFGHRTMAVVLAAGQSLAELRAAVEAGMEEYDAYLYSDEVAPVVPMKMELAQNYPNPFNPQTTIRFCLAAARQTTLAVYNVTGQRVRTLFDGPAPAGDHTIVWDGRDDSGATVATGIYFYRLTAGEETLARKMVFLK